MKTKLKTLGIIILSTIGVALIFVIIGKTGMCFQDNDQKLIGNIITMLFPVAVYFYVKILNKKINKLSPKNYGFGFKNFLTNILSGIGIALAIMSLVLVLGKTVFGIPIEIIGLKDDFQTPLLNIVTTFIIVGAWEEFFFRGFVFNSLLKNNYGFHLSALVSAILFSAVHFSSFDFSQTSYFWYIGIIFIGYILVYIYAYFKSIWAVAFFHFSWNFIVTLLSNKNEIGLLQISNYTENTKTIDNIQVFVLGLILLLILILEKRNGISKRIKSYISQITTANNGYK